MGAFASDAGEERFLDRMNRRLQPLEEELYRDIPLEHPVVFVVGVPRSGTTVLTQLLAAHTGLGYVNQLIASFWLAPVQGVRLSRRLLPATYASDFRSRYGRTTSILEPHEFGYFWRRLLDYDGLRIPEPGDEERIDWDRFRLTLANLVHAFGTAPVFKSFHAGWHVPAVRAALPASAFIRVRRDLDEVAASLLRMRREFLGSEQRWASFRPPRSEFGEVAPERLSPVGQVVAQARLLDRRLQRGIDAIDGAHVLEITHRELQRDPATVLDAVGTLLEGLDFRLEITRTPPTELVPPRAGAADPDLERVKRYVEDRGAGHPWLDDR